MLPLFPMSLYINLLFFLGGGKDCLLLFHGTCANLESGHLKFGIIINSTTGSVKPAGSHATCGIFFPHSCCTGRGLGAARGGATRTSWVGDAVENFQFSVGRASGGNLHFNHNTYSELPPPL